MPVGKSAKKKLRQDKKRQIKNKGVLTTLKKLVKKAQKGKAEKDVLNAIKIADKAAGKNIIHKNKAARIKSKLQKLIKKTEKPSPVKKSPKK